MESWQPYKRNGWEKKITSGAVGTRVEAHTLNPGQVMMTFSILCGAILLSFLVLAIEYLIINLSYKAKLFEID